MSARMKRREFITPLGGAAERRVRLTKDQQLVGRIARGDGDAEGHQR